MRLKAYFGIFLIHKGSDSRVNVWCVFCLVRSLSFLPVDCNHTEILGLCVWLYSSLTSPQKPWQHLNWQQSVCDALRAAIVIHCLSVSGTDVRLLIMDVPDFFLPCIHVSLVFRNWVFLLCQLNVFQPCPHVDPRPDIVASVRQMPSC